MGITKYGTQTLGGVALLALTLCLIAFFMPATPLFAALSALLYGTAAFLVGFTLQFFRDPERTPPTEKNVIVSPADGTVVLIKPVAHHAFFNAPAVMVSVFMSPLNVHVNRIPLSGTVTHFKYIEGEYLVAFDHASGEKNERTEIGIESERVKVFFKQISGYVARRIVWELQVGDAVRLGARFGMIKFGSRVDVFLPQSVMLKVKEGDTARAGETVLAAYSEVQD